MRKYPGGDPENGPAFNDVAKDHLGRPIYTEYGDRLYYRKDGQRYLPMRRKLKRSDNQSLKIMARMVTRQ